ncbi:MAG: hypothetical protein ABIK19_04715 [candidate division WOR-3 bacterium]
MIELKVGNLWGRGKFARAIREKIELSNGWILIKTDDSKSDKDFKVKTIFSLQPVRSMTPKHAHFAIDFYGKLCANKEKASKILKSIDELWKGSKEISQLLREYSPLANDLPGYSLEYILYALNWILEQEDINFQGRPDRKQKELEQICRYVGIQPNIRRQGSLLAISLLCDIYNGTHPVEALLKANLDIRPKKIPERK